MIVDKMWISFVFLFDLYCVLGHLFTCTENFQESKKTAVKLVKNMDKYIRQEELKIEVLKRISLSIRSQLTEELNGTKPVPPNPVSMYLYAKTISDASYSITQIINNLKADRHLKEFQATFKYKLPGEVDLKGVLTSFTRLQNTYNVTPPEMASGNVLGIQVPVLSAYDCYDIGKFVYETGYTRIALQWMQTSVDKIKHLNSGKAKEFLADVNEFITEIKRQDRLDRIRTRMQLLTNRLENFNTTEVAEFQSMVKNNSMMYYGIEFSRNANFTKRYENTCLTRNTRFGGVCKYLGFQDLTFFKQPIKVEYINKSPMILVVHDIISQNLLEKLKGFANQLQRSKIYHGDDSLLRPLDSSTRTSSTYNFMEDMTDPDVIQFNDRLERLTGLRTNIRQADHLQIVNYGIGGEFQPHFDWLDETLLSGDLQTKTNRVLTIILYLSDVEVGGSTVFPELGLAVSPVKGSALIFTNLDKEEQGDKATLHAGCPVFFGSKWIANKWIHKKDQDMNFLQTIPSIWEHFSL
ncbi:prolyl 4-hydroxylase subunit alpha-2-like isoform X1 [Mytilus trossulus]|uniref:prolyl 4-hydroxylase subunit alpha-2-like isoform X1 n=1 Tax=Mytilus trossulus TaxID=6551 RepID=UPI003007CE0E